jgi:CheY-like chemotaxis protein
MAAKLQVLVVEDDPNDVLLLKRAFSKGGPEMPLQFARDGQEALDYLKGVDRFADRNLYPLPTLLVVDLKLPGIDGFEIIRWVRKESELRDLRIVVLSSSNEPSDISRAHHLGANAYHVKPNDPNALVGMVEGLKTYWADRNAGPDAPAL